MAKYRITSPDGASFEITAPDDATPDQVQAFAQQQFAQMKPGPVGDAKAGGVAGGIKQGLRDPIDAGAQMLRRVVPDAVGEAVDNFGNWLSSKGLPVAPSTGVAGVDKIVKTAGQQYEADRQAAGRDGFDFARLGGNVFNPTNVLIPGGGAAAAARTLPQLARAGATMGAAGAALQPVVGDTDNFWTEKAKQAAGGAVAGAVLTPALAKGTEAVARPISAAMQRSAAQQRTVTQDTVNNAVERMIQAQGMRIDDVPPVILDSVRRQMADSLRTGAKLDGAAAIRAAQAEALGLTGDAALTAGQLTRNPLQWAREQNLSGIMFDTPAGPQNPLATRFQTQQQRLRSLFDNLGATGASDRVTGGEVALGALQAANKRADDEVRAAYRAFEQSTGRQMEVPLQGLAQDFAATVDKFDDAIPGAVRKKFEALGLMGGQQKKLLTIDGAEDLIKIINANTDPANRRAFRALGELRAAVNKAIEEGADRASTGAGAEAAMLGREARDIARGVFQTRQNVRALDAAAKDVAPDQFLERFLLNRSAPTRDVDAMMQVIRQDPQALGEVRSQVAAYLKNAAFGTDLAGDKVIAADRFARALEALGPQKLALIFTPEEAIRLNIAAKLAAEMQSVPAGAQRAVNYSNTANGIFNLLQGLSNVPALRQIPGMRSIANQAGQIANERAANAALQPAQAATAPAAELSPEARRALARLFAPAAVAGGVTFGSGF